MGAQRCKFGLYVFACIGVVAPLTQTSCVSQITTTIILPFDDTVEQSAGLIHTVYAIFITEMITSPVIGMSDVVGNFKKHFLGPRAPDQKRMNLDFRGAFYEMSERYTVSPSYRCSRKHAFRVADIVGRT